MTYSRALLGSITQFTDNTGTAFNPATTVSVTITVQNSAATAIAGAEVSIFKTADDSVILASTNTDANGQVSTTVASSLGAIYVRVRQSTSNATFLTSQGFGSEIITTDATHTIETGEAVNYSKNGGTENVGLTVGTIYYVNDKSGTTLTLHNNVADAISDSSPVDLTTSGAETHIIDPIRYLPNSTVGTVGATNFSATITMVVDTTVTG